MDALTVCLDNLSRLDPAEASVLERRLAHWKELTAVLASRVPPGEPFYRSDAFQRLYADTMERAVPLLYRPEEGAPPENAAPLALRQEDASLQGRVTVCGELSRLLVPDGDLLAYFPDETEEAGETVNRISYVKNYYADYAYRRFAALLESPRVTYSDDFSGVCEDLYAERARYGILPIGNTTDGVLTRFRALIARYELKLVLTADVPLSDGEGATRFALLKRGVDILPVGEGETCFRFSLPLSGPERSGKTVLPEQVLHAARAFGLTLREISSAPGLYGDSDPVCEVELQVGTGNLPGFLCFLSLEVPRFTPSGVYTHLI